jgi:hypothetical protein
MPIDVSVKNTGDPMNEERIRQAVRAIPTNEDWKVSILGSASNTKFEVKLSGGPKNIDETFYTYGEEGGHHPDHIVKSLKSLMQRQ